MHKTRAREGAHFSSVCISTDRYGFVYMVEDGQLSYSNAYSMIARTSIAMNS
jgi:hypothetical protein